METLRDNISAFPKVLGGGEFYNKVVNNRFVNYKLI